MQTDKSKHTFPNILKPKHTKPTQVLLYHTERDNKKNRSSANHIFIRRITLSWAKQTRKMDE